MSASNFLTVVLLVFLTAIRAEQFYNESKMSVEVSPRVKELADRELATNPIMLDAAKNEVFPGKVLTVFSSPHFIGSPPPGITNFMLTQVLLSAQKKNGTVYPLFTKEALRLVTEDGVVLLDTKCEDSKGKKSNDCKPGYKQVVVKKTSSSGCEAPSAKTQSVVEEKTVTAKGETSSSTIS
ncbi:uncharacterized protein VICG_00424 [Vittaforma corneae ATCC 50505]|uniref:Uncharacterized protein n=1 Tax=Vittaforma corneae (strain ATCC 50505) TaxID=993615 RepID=L2GQT4_VITCO|nr:uncharacterized protein VICG_00424 [Vittaforma corneae ATCC 50505]ELA42672.1 hypothetical protein VICG_00424 [Vittaforma corneae ATCC 50505]